MPGRRVRISEGATLEEQQAFLLKTVKRLRKMASLSDNLTILEEIETAVVQMRQRNKTALD